jgi:hypothetical protein
MEGESDIVNSTKIGPIVTIPISDIYRIHLLDNQGKIKTIYVFSGGARDLQTVFSESEINEINTKAIEVVFSTQQIHKDDSIRIIKKKIIHEIGEQELCYDEIYFFANVTVLDLC